jgi:hypothetical protein
LVCTFTIPQVIPIKDHIQNSIALRIELTRIYGFTGQLTQQILKELINQ